MELAQGAGSWLQGNMVHVLLCGFSLSCRRYGVGEHIMDELMSQNEEGLSMPEEETMSFEDLGLDEITLAAIEKKGFV